MRLPRIPQILPWAELTVADWLFLAMLVGMCVIPPLTVLIYVVIGGRPL